MCTEIKGGGSGKRKTIIKLLNVDLYDLLNLYGDIAFLKNFLKDHFYFVLNNMIQWTIPHGHVCV